MSTTTTNYGLIKPDTTDPILVGQLNDNADVIDATLKSLSDALDVAKLGIKYKGEVNYYSNLPSSGNQIGDAYTVKYAGSSGTTPDGTEYVWGTVSGTNQWINFSKDSYTKAEVDALLALKVDTAGTGLSKSGTTLNHSNSTTAKTTQGFAQIAYDAQGHITGSTAATTAQANAINSGIDSEKVAQIETNKNNISFINQKVGVNLVNSASESGIRWINIEVDLPAGTYTCGFGSLTGDDSGVSQVTFYGADYAVIQPERSKISKGNNVYVNNIVVTGAVKIIRIYAASDSTTSQNKGVSYTNLFVCKQEAWDASVGVQPYALSNAELTKLSKWNYTETRYTNTGTSDYENTGVSFTAPVNQSIEFYAYDRKDGAYLDKILVCDSLTTLGNTTIISANSIIDGFTDAQYWTLQTTGIVPTFKTDVTYYIWVKRKSTGSNPVGLAWRYLSR